MTYTHVNTIPLPVDDTNDEIDITHVYCCQDENVALCGVDLTGAKRVAGDPNCVECKVAVEKQTCPRLFFCIDPETSFSDS